jgi:hypothetical protein
MCFSATASFGAGVVLSAIGIASIKKVKEPGQYAFAGIPLLFAVQQFTEGFVWLALKDPEYSSLLTITSFTFVVFAQVVWPLWVPLAMYLMEKKNGRKRVLFLLTIAGLIVSVYRSYCIMTDGVVSSIAGHHIAYLIGTVPPILGIGPILYFLATVAPSFFSSVRGVWAIGLAILISFISAEIFFPQSVISVWCYFAALISVVVLLVMRRFKRY